MENRAENPTANWNVYKDLQNQKYINQGRIVQSLIKLTQGISILVL